MRLTYLQQGVVWIGTLLGLAWFGSARFALADNVFNGLASLETYGINADFEDPEQEHMDDDEDFSNGDIGPGWSLNLIDGTSSNFGVQDPETGYYGFQSPDGPLIAPFEGRQIGFVNTDSAATGDLVSKSLGTIKSGQSYSLSVAVGVRTGTTWSEAYEVGLQTLGGVDVGTLTNSGIMNTAETNDLSYNLSSGQAAGFVGQEVAIVIRSHNTNPAGAFSQGNFDNVRLTGTFGDAVFPTLTIDRGTGNINLSKTGPNLSGFSGYELGSEAGSFDAENWSSIADNYDEGGSVDSDDAWTETSASSTTLAEAQISIPAGDGGTLSGAVNLGNAWLQTPYEDVTGTLLTTDGVERTIQIEYVGDPIPVGDLTGDGMVTGVDWTAFKNGQGSDFNGLSSAQGYLLGDLDDNGSHDLSDFLLFRNAYETFNGAGSFAALLNVPEPATATLLLVSAFVGSLTWLGRRRPEVGRTAMLLLAVCGVLACSEMAIAGRVVDRLYQFGEDELEGDTADGVALGMASGNQFAGRTLDSKGTIPQDFQDLEAFGGNYIDTFALGRPGATSGELGASFDGVDDHVQTTAGSGAGFNNPSISPSSMFNETPGSNDYSSIINRGFQVWLYPNAGGNTAGNTQHIVHDMDEHGIRISAGGNWEMRYRSTTFNSGVPVGAFDQWYHVMLVIPHGIGGVAAANDTDGAVMYVDGVAVGAIGGNYDYDEDTELVVGSNLNGMDNFFNGVLDQLEFFAWGRTANGVDYGRFNLAEDNLFVVEELNGVAGDINQSGSVEQGDIDDLVAGYGMAKVINNVRVGDLTTYANGDLNFDGITDLTDVRLLADALPAGSGSGLDTSGLLRIIQGIPEPSTMLLGLIAMGALAGLRRHGRTAGRVAVLLLAAGLVVWTSGQAQAERVARWTFDNGPDDEVNGMLGTLFGNAAIEADALNEGGQVLVLDDFADGTVEGSSHLYIHDTDGLLDFGEGNTAGNDGSATVAAWVLTPDVWTVHDQLFGQGEWNDGVGLAIKPDRDDANGFPRLWTGFAGGPTFLSGTGAGGVPEDAAWHHVAVTFDYDGANTTVNFFLDGAGIGVCDPGVDVGCGGGEPNPVFAGRVNSPVDNMIAATGLPGTDGVGDSRIGLEWRNADVGAVRWPVAGSIDDVQIWNEALDEAGIQEIMMDRMGDGTPINLYVYADPATGIVTVVNETENPVMLNSYRLTSEGQHLTEEGSQSITASGGFPVGNGSGNGWELGPNNDDGEIVEWYLTGDSMINVGQQISVGTAFDTTTLEEDRDLAFRYVTDTGSQRGASIFYEAAPEVGDVLGDYNGDGVVNAADYVVYRNTLASGGTLMNESASPGVTDQADYDYWVSRFGATSGSGSGSGQSAVPEPSAVVLLAGGLLVAMCSRGRLADAATSGAR